MSGGRKEEEKIKQEFLWLHKHQPMREYMFVCVIQDLDDDIPW